MIFETKIINKFKADLYYHSPIPGFRFSVPEDGFLTHRTSDPYNVLARYSEIIFEKGREVVKRTADSNVLTRRLYPGKIKCVIRPDWEEPKRAFPTVWFLNLTECPLVTIIPDVFNQNKKLYLFMQIPVLAEVPVYSQFAKYKRYEIHPPIPQLKQMPGMVDSYDEIEDNRLLGERSKQEQERLARLRSEWKEAEKDRIKLM